LGSFLCATLAGLLGAFVGGGASATLGGVYLCVLLDAAGLCAVVGGGVELLPWLAVERWEWEGVECWVWGGLDGGELGGVVCCGG